MISESISRTNMYNNLNIVCNFTNGNKYGVIKNNYDKLDIILDENGITQKTMDVNKKYLLVKFLNNNSNIDNKFGFIPKNIIIPLNFVENRNYIFKKNLDNIKKMELLILDKIKNNNINKLITPKENCSYNIGLKVPRFINKNNKTRVSIGNIIKIPKRNSIIFKNFDFKNKNTFLFNCIHFTKKNFIENGLIFIINPKNTNNKKIQNDVVYELKNKKYYYFVKFGENIHLCDESVVKNNIELCSKINI